MKKYFTLFCFVFSVFVVQDGLAQQVQLNNNIPLTCGVSDSNLSTEILQLLQTAQTNVSQNRIKNENLREIRLAIVVDSTVYFSLKKDTNAIKESIFKTVRKASKIFEESLNIRLNVIFIEFSMKNRQYNSIDGSYNAFYKFQDDYEKRNDILRDIMILWSIRRSEPYAGVASRVGWQEKSAIHYATTIYSIDKGITEGLFSHEIGHVLGSPHTHSCSWANGPFEVCNGVEGDCKNIFSQDLFASLMSYCNWGGTNGLPYFHPLCIDVMQKHTYPVLKVMSKTPQTSPILIYPKNSDIALGQTKSNNFYPTDYFFWSSIEQITSYNVVISEKSDFSEIILDSLVQENTFYMNKSLKRNMIYYWKVRAKNQIGNGDWSQVFSFRTHDNITLKTPLLNRIDETRYGPDNIFSFKPVNDAKEYIIQFFQEANSQVHFEKAIQFTSFRIEDMLKQSSEGYYTWRVKAINEGLSSNWSENQPFYYHQRKVFFDRYRLPVSTSVPLIFEDGLSLSFKSLDRTSELEVSENSNFNQLINAIKIKHNYLGEANHVNLYMPIILDSLSPNKTYYYRYKIKSLIDSSDWVKSNFTTSYEHRWKMYSYKNSIMPFNSTITNNIFIDKQNNRWLTGNIGGGVIMISSDGRVQNKFTPENTNQILPYQIKSIQEDTLNRLWFATTDGLILYDKGVWKSFPYTLWSSNRGDNYISLLAVSNKNSVFFYTGVGKLIRYDGNTWKDIKADSNMSSDALMRTDSNGNLWSISNSNGNNGVIKIYDGIKWNNFKYNWSFLKNSDVFLDNEGSVYFQTNDSLFIVKDLSGNYQSISTNSISAIDDETGTKTTLSLSIIAAYKSNNGNTCYLAAIPYVGYRILETDNKQWRLRTYFGGVWAGGIYIKTSFAIDKNGNTLLLHGRNLLTEFNPKDIIADFNTKVAVAGSKLTFRIGIATPPTGTAEQNSLKVYLSDSSSTTFKPILATYQNGEVMINLPTMLKGSGYRLKYTMGNNWLESNESTPFDILALPKLKVQINGKPFYCADSISVLTATVSGGTGNYTYQWKKENSDVGTKSNTYNVTQAGIYSVVVTDDTGQSVISETINVKERKVIASITPAAPEIIYLPNTLKLTVSKIDSAIYQWKKNGTKIIGAIQDIYTVKESGNYSVDVTVSGCVAKSNVVKVSIEAILAIEEPSTYSSDLALSIEPNPTTEIVKLSISSKKYLPITIQLIDFKGQLIQQWYSYKNIDSFNMLVDLSKMPAGIYIINVQNKEENIVKRVIKQ